MSNPASHPADDLLVMEAQDGDRRAMEMLVRRWQKRLWLHAHRLTGDPEAAWDITQQAWLAIIKGLGTLHDPARFKPWAYQIVTHKATDLRKAKRGDRPLPDAPLTDTRIRGPEESAPAELLESLDADKRAVLALYYLEGLSVAEIGSVLGIPVGTVKSRLHNARNTLRSRWREELT